MPIVQVRTLSPAGDGYDRTFSVNIQQTTSTQNAPWVIINSNDKKVGILNAMRYVLSQVEYPDKNPGVIEWYPEVVNVLKLN